MSDDAVSDWKDKYRPEGYPHRDWSPSVYVDYADKEISKLEERIAVLEAENKQLWSEQHEAQRVYRRLLAELEEQRAINEELREAQK